MYDKINNLPLYKYMTIEVAQIVLVNRTLRWSSPVLFDDPLDVKRQFDLGFPIEELVSPMIEELNYIYQNKDLSHIKNNSVFNYITSLFNERVPDEVKNEFYREILDLVRSGVFNSQKWVDELNKEWKKLIPEMRILCFSEKPNIVSMWASYGGNHSGAVCEFISQKHTDSPWLLAEKVTYTDDPMLIATPKEWAKSALGIEPLDYTKIFERYGCVKTTDWAYQQEWRVFSFKRPHEDGLHSDYQFAPTDLRAIYLGYKTDNDTIVTIKGLLRHGLGHVELFKAEPNEASRSFEFARI
jgi:hypothetical protein